MISKQLREFELLNTVSESIYELNGLRVLIILKDGSNLTSWEDVENKEDIIYISEDLFGETNLVGRYAGLTSLKAIIASGFGKVETMKGMFVGCESLVDVSALANWDVSSVVDMRGMFHGCKSLEDISPLASWNVSSLLLRMFLPWPIGM